jgi:hypothetical protein
MDKTRFDLLLQRYLDGQLEPEEKLELEEWLLSDPRARKEFWAVARTHGLLRLWGEAEWGRQAANRQAASTTREEQLGSVWHAVVAWLRQPFRLAAVTAGVAAVLALFIFWRTNLPTELPPVANLTSTRQDVFQENTPPTPPAASAGIAVLKRVADVVWEPGTKEYQPGDTLLRGWLRLRSGAVQIEFTRGARVVLEGPAAFELVSSEEGHLESGRVRAHVDGPASGFRITSAAFDLVDHGTDFGCQVPAQGPAEVHVFKGAVEMAPHQQGESARSLTANQAVAVTTNGVQNISVNAGVFLGEQELAQRELSDFNERYASWRQYSHLLSEHTNILLHYTFEDHNTWERGLPNQARNAIPGTDAALVGCNWSQGRWPGKGAVEFIRTDDRIRVHVPGEFRSLTFLAWLRVDSLPNHYTSLAMTESLEVGEVHWAIASPGNLLLAARKVPPTNPGDWEGATALGALKPEMAGAWVMIASVYDADQSTVTHFVNGDMVGRSMKIEFPEKLKLGNFEIGNWGVRADDPRWARLKQAGSVILNRSFKGRIDEFALFTAPLSAEEIHKIYDHGKPVSSAMQVAALPEHNTPR